MLSAWAALDWFRRFDIQPLELRFSTGILCVLHRMKLIARREKEKLRLLERESSKERYVDC